MDPYPTDFMHDGVDSLVPLHDLEVSEASEQEQDIGVPRWTTEPEDGQQRMAGAGTDFVGSIKASSNGQECPAISDRSAAAGPSGAEPHLAERRPVSAADISEERMLRPRSATPQRGWRRALYLLSAGMINPGPGPAELRARERIATIKTPLRGSRTIAVVSTKGGVGKTTSTVNLGHTFATYRGDRIVALDGNPDAGSLGYRVRRETSATADDLLAEVEAISRYSDLRAFTSQAGSRLEVIASPDDPGVSRALGEPEYQRLVGLLEHHYNVILVDCGTGILDSATRGIVDIADQLVVVTGPSVDSARATSYLLDWLESHGLSTLVAGAVAVVNGVPQRKGLVDVSEVEDHFAQRCRRVVCIPWDKHLAAGAGTSLDECTRETRDAYTELAAAVAEEFARPTREEFAQ
jgi:putative peptide zinc metalloprotease protein